MRNQQRRYLCIYLQFYCILYWYRYVNIFFFFLAKSGVEFSSNYFSVLVPSKKTNNNHVLSVHIQTIVSVADPDP
jgi:hypothetical protein